MEITKKLVQNITKKINLETRTAAQYRSFSTKRPKKRWEAISQQGWNKRGSLGGLIELVNGKAVKNV